MSREPVEVESASNSRLKLARSLVSTRGIRKAGLYLLEGPRYVSDALRWSRIDFLVLSRDATETCQTAARRAMAQGVNCISVPPALFAEVSDTAHSQGLAAVCPLPDIDPAHLLTGRLLLALDGVSDPGNVGTSIRSAAALGASGVALFSGCASAFVPKSTRASAGAVTAIPVAQGLDPEGFLRSARKSGWKLLVADASGRPVVPNDRRGKTLLIVGSEAHGPSEEVSRLADLSVSIPITERVESLNAATSAAILLYALSREPD